VARRVASRACALATRSAFSRAIGIGADRLGDQPLERGVLVDERRRPRGGERRVGRQVTGDRLRQGGDGLGPRVVGADLGDPGARDPGLGLGDVDGGLAAGHHQAARLVEVAALGDARGAPDLQPGLGAEHLDVGLLDLLQRRALGLGEGHLAGRDRRRRPGTGRPEAEVPDAPGRGDVAGQGLGGVGQRDPGRAPTL
jgi:hypothetical protein